MTDDGSARERELFAAWDEAARVGPEHAILRELVGEYDVDQRFRLAADLPLHKGRSRACCRLILGDRTLEIDLQSIREGGFQARGYLGYDRVDRCYTFTWLETTTTQREVRSGQLSEDGRSIRLAGRATDPITGRAVDSVLTVVLLGARGFRIEIHQQSPAGPYRSFEADYERARGEA